MKRRKCKSGGGPKVGGLGSGEKDNVWDFSKSFSSALRTPKPILNSANHIFARPSIPGSSVINFIDSFSGGAVIYCNPTLDSDVWQSNKHFFLSNLLNEDVAWKLWQAINSIGVKGKENYGTYEKIIRSMEKRDKEGKLKREAKLKKIQ